MNQRIDHKYRIGDRVICVESKLSVIHNHSLTLGEVYTIEKFYTNDCIGVVGVYGACMLRRFAPYDDEPED